MPRFPSSTLVQRARLLTSEISTLGEEYVQSVSRLLAVHDTPSYDFSGCKVTPRNSQKRWRKNQGVSYEPEQLEDPSNRRESRQPKRQLDASQ
jgi:hypothetical protein